MCMNLPFQFIDFFCLRGNLSWICCLLIFFQNQFVVVYLKMSFGNISRVSRCFDSDHAPFFVRPDLGPSCLQRLSADNTKYSK